MTIYSSIHSFIRSITGSQCQTERVNVTLKSQRWNESLLNKESSEFKTMESNILSAVSFSISPLTHKFTHVHHGKWQIRLVIIFKPCLDSLHTLIRVHNNLRLFWFCFITACDWFNKLEPFSQTIRKKIKTNCDLFVSVFPRGNFGQFQLS